MTNPARRRLLGRVLLMAAFVLPVRKAPAVRLPGKLRLKIEAGSAPIALAEFVRQSGLQVLFETDAIRDHATRAVSGQFDAAEALAVMLEGSGLVFEFINDRTIAVRPQSMTRPAGKEAVPPKPVDVGPV